MDDWPDFHYEGRTSCSTSFATNEPLLHFWMQELKKHHYGMKTRTVSTPNQKRL